jgi:hypothetical protein
MLATAELEQALRGGETMRRLAQGSAPKGPSREAAEHWLFFALQGMKLIRLSWGPAREAIYAGMEASVAQREAERFRALMQEWSNFLGIVCADGEAVARRDGVAVDDLEEARAAQGELTQMLVEANDVLEVLARPRPPMNREMARKAREAWERDKAAGTS